MTNRSLAASLLAAWGIFGAFAAFSIVKPLTLDQAWPIAFKAGSIAERGAGELGRLPYEIAHPPLYEHVLAIFFRALGETDFSARALGAVCFAATSLLLIPMARSAFPDSDWRRVGALAALLYAVSPFALQHSLIVDASTTLLPLLTAAFFLALYRCDLRISRRSVWPVGACLALCIWAHESLAMLPVAAGFLHLWRARGLRIATCSSLAILASGLGLFVASWALYTWATGVPALGFVKFSVTGKLLNPSHGVISPAEYFSRISTNLRWVSIPALALLAILARRRVGAPKPWREAEPSDLLWIYVGLVLLVTHSLWTHLPRYVFTAYAPLCLLLADGVIRSGIPGARGWLASIALGLLLAALLGDPLLMGGRMYLVTAVLVPIAFAYAAISALGGSLRPESRIPSMLLMAFVSVATWTQIEQTSPYTTSVSWTEYGESGFEETLRHLETHAGGTTPMIRKDLAYALLRGAPDRSLRWSHNQAFRNLSDPGSLAHLETELGKETIRIVVLDRYSDSRRARLALEEGFAEVVRYGDFSVFHRRPDARNGESSPKDPVGTGLRRKSPTQ